MQPFFRLLQVGTFQELQTLRSLDLSNCLLEAEKPLEVAVAVGVPMLRNVENHYGQSSSERSDFVNPGLIMFFFSGTNYDQPGDFGVSL